MIKLRGFAEQLTAVTQTLSVMLSPEEGDRVGGFQIVRATYHVVSHYTAVVMGHLPMRDVRKLPVSNSENGKQKTHALPKRDHSCVYRPVNRVVNDIAKLSKTENSETTVKQIRCQANVTTAFS